MRKSRYNEYVRCGLTAFFAGALLIIFNQIVVHFSGFSEGLHKLNIIISPFIYGFGLAYIVSPIYNFVVRHTYHFVEGKTEKKRRVFAFSRVVGSLVIVFIIIGASAGFLALVVPEFIKSLAGIMKNLPQNLAILTDYLQNISGTIKNPEMAENIDSLIDRTEKQALSLAERKFIPGLDTYMTKVSEGLIVTLKTVLNMIIGMIVCIYVLNIKETLKAQTKKIILSISRDKVADEIFNFLNFANRTFGGFISGKIIDSIIIGFICFGAMNVMGLPYPVLISTIIGVTNIIPFFGPFIGAIPSMVIIAITSPIQALYFLIMILVLQQIDGNIIGPAILGNSTGLASFWVMFAIIVGGGLFGFIGMILGVPVFAIIYYYIGRIIKKKLHNKNLPGETWDYTSYRKLGIPKDAVKKKDAAEKGQ